MLQSAKIQSRQSEIRESIATLSGKADPSADEIRQMDDLSTEYRSNETRYRAALVAEDTERRDAGKDLETRQDKQWSDLVSGFELRQVALYLDEGKALDGRTAEVVQEMRSTGGYRGVPIPLEALEVRAGETIASGIPDPVSTQPIIDRLFPASVAGAMGGRLVNIPAGSVEYPITTDGATAAWAASETGNVGDTSAYATAQRTLSPEQTLGVQMKITRKSMKQAGGIEAAIRRDMQAAIQTEMDRAVFLGTGATGQPSGIITGASGYGIVENSTAGVATWAKFRAEIVEFLKNNTANGPGDVRVMIRPEVWDYMDGAIFDAGSGITEWDRFAARVQSAIMTSNALAAPATDVSKALLTTTVGGDPFFIGIWGGVDLIRDPYSDAQSGGLRLTGLVTMDVTAGRSTQLRVLTAVGSADGE
ncbi:phage major capsid protein [Pusillimonas noertemannii]|uniref:Capsid family protein n=1 Tax=Pusillimonas noertemannii TaxID=305977 RepID=A0A2U1CR57_9BURK|nr:phage major capsid protein [Pusillimonas noertemannii]NYT67707.1 phage major capsid protein [Pusillimonas noertemannii]PVY68378.1 capsid family protein [Pusillimonas noertemannii]TFL12137.1 phage major capsid protein [Pusillimonas noertemannii]